MTPPKTKPQTGPRAKQQAAIDPDEPAIVIDGVQYKFKDLTLGELSELEDFTGLPMDAISYGSAKTISFVVYLVRRRNESDYTLEDAQKIQIRSLNNQEAAVEVGDASEGPTQASSE